MINLKTKPVSTLPQVSSLIGSSASQKESSAQEKPAIPLAKPVDLASPPGRITRSGASGAQKKAPSLLKIKKPSNKEIDAAAQVMLQLQKSGSSQNVMPEDENHDNIVVDNSSSDPKDTSLESG
ncbi:MAG: hypothetical protein H0W88_11890 [Parachlamydiaceae bacterium]|nr:hypothetical protein [Parachlamydiaceae bacterium]